MRKILLVVLVVFITSCSENLQKKAEKLVEIELSDGYKEKPNFIFNDELTKLVDKKRNELIGYQLIYEVVIPKLNYKHKHIATFDLKVENVISNDVYIEPEEFNFKPLPIE